MKKGFKLIVPSLLAIIVCVLLLAGSTFALFTSDVTKNIVVGSATVNMTAKYTEFKAYSVEATDNNTSDDYAGEATAYGVTSHYNYVEVSANSETAKTFANKGTATLTDENIIELVNVTPGDRITANLTVTNNSNVDIIYRVRLNAISDNGLLDGLTVKAGGETLTGVIKVGAWTPWNVPTEQTKVENIALEVFLPVEAGNEYQTKQATLRFTIEAVQANAKTDTLLDQVNASLAGSAKVNKTMYDAIQEAETAYSTFDGSKYLWSPDTDQFYAPYTVVAGFESHFFKAYSQAEFNELTEQKYNIYATGEWTGIGSTNPVNITVGFDAGEATGLTHISYVRNQESDKAQEVIIRTNSANTNLVIDAPKDIVHHYGDAGSLTIIAVAGQSYHENGNVGFLEIKNGRVALETNSTVQQIHLSTTTINAGTETEDKVFDNIVIAKAEDVEMPAFSRDPVEIPEDGKLVVALQSSTEEEADKDYVWLTAIGVYEQVTVSDSSTSAGETYASEMTAQSTEEAEVQKVADQKQAAQQIANNISVGLGTDTYTVTAQKNETTGDWEYSLKGETQEATQAVAEYTVTVEEVVEQEVKTTQVTVENNQTPVETTTTVQNGLTEEQKAEEKKTSMDQAKAISEDAAYITNMQELNAYITGTKVKGIVGADIDVTGVMNLGSDKELDLNGYTFNIKMQSARPFVFTEAHSFTIDANGGKMIIPSGYGAYGLFRIEASGSELILNGGTYNKNTNDDSAIIWLIKTGTHSVNVELNNVNATCVGQFVRDHGLGVNYYYYLNQYGEEYINNLSVNGGNYVFKNEGINNGGSVSGFILQSVNATFDGVTITSDIGSIMELDCGVGVFRNNTFTVNQSNTIQNWNGTTIGAAYGATIKIESGTYTGHDYGVSTFTTGGHLEISGGTITGGINALDLYGNTDYLQYFGQSSCEISGGTIVGNIGTYSYTGDPDISITGGTFDHDPSDYVHEDYYAVDNGNSVWTIAQKDYVATVEFYDEEEGWIDLYYTSLRRALEESQLSEDLKMGSFEIHLLADINENISFDLYEVGSSYIGEIHLDGHTLAGNITLNGTTMMLYGGTVTANIVLNDVTEDTKTQNCSLYLGEDWDSSYYVNVTGQITINGEESNLFIAEGSSASNVTNNGGNVYNYNE